MSKTDKRVGVLTSYRCKKCGASLYVNGNLKAWCSTSNHDNGFFMPSSFPFVPTGTPEDEIIVTLRAELGRVRGERDAARRAAAHHKRRAEAVYRYWCSYWGGRADWNMLRDALATLREVHGE